MLTEGQEGDIVYQYITFTKVFDEQTRLYGPTLKAVTETIRICIVDYSQVSRHIFV